MKKLLNHNHDLAPARFGRAFAIGISLNVGFVAIEAFYGWRSGSLALLADAAHNLSDVGGLALAWAGLAAARLRANDRHTYGWQRGSIMASFGNALILFVAMSSLAWEAAHRLHSPSSMEGATVMVVAGIGIVINAATAFLFMRGSNHDLNIRGAFLHMTADATVSLGVVIAGALYWWKGWAWIDPVVSLVIAGIVVVGTWSLFHRSLHLLFDGVPDGISLSQVRKLLLGIPNVIGIHDLHVWAVTTSRNSLTAHLVVSGYDTNADALIKLATKELQDEFEIEHITLQIESERYAATCGQASRHIQGADSPV